MASSKTVVNESADRGHTIRCEYAVDRSDDSLANGKEAAMGKKMDEKGTSRAISGNKVPEL